ncbi:alpha/beta hydrolase [Niallia endozanthoxylica]|uniref:Alpha/beta hydrolase n=1 Tax=Niallia endozanthoxylica TaxID=2036016 RepID=A0A5J5HT44_9BACI|nr:alpha/beta hydrolase [Niallia endozanthoxylica]KAA9025760.1 alpha/beta hydrolase [Niallia endozanthoxylica]
MKQSVFINWKEEQLSATIDYPDNLKEGVKYPLVIICHGFIGSKVGVDRLFVKAAQQLNQDQLIVLRFDLSGCGESSGNYGQTGLHDFIDQLRTVIDFSCQLKQINSNQITLLGHSLGGATAVLTAVKDVRIKRLILWSSVAYPLEDISRIVGKENVRSLELVSEFDYLGYSLTMPFFESLAFYQPLQSTVHYSGNVLIVHGTGDDDIPVKYAKEYEKTLSKRLSGKVIRYEINGANHTYSNAAHFTELIQTTRKWVCDEMNIEQKQNVSNF